VAATVVLSVMAATVDEYVWGGDSLKGGRAEGSVGREHRTIACLVVPHAVQRVRCPGACAPAVLCAGRDRLCQDCSREAMCTDGPLYWE